MFTFILIRGLVEIREFTDDFIYEPLLTTNIGSVRYLEGVNLQLAYSPRNPVLESLVNRVSEELEFSLPVEARENAHDLGNWASTWSPFASIEFEDNLRVRKVDYY